MANIVFGDAEGPYETSRQMPGYQVTIGREFGQGLLMHGVKSGFDLAEAGSCPSIIRFSPASFSSSEKLPVAITAIRSFRASFRRSDRSYFPIARCDLRDSFAYIL
jgi:hypothetical protein